MTTANRSKFALELTIGQIMGGQRWSNLTTDRVGLKYMTYEQVSLSAFRTFLICRMRAHLKCFSATSSSVTTCSLAAFGGSAARPLFVKDPWARPCAIYEGPMVVPPETPSYPG